MIKNFSLSVLRPGAPEADVNFEKNIASAWGITVKLSVCDGKANLSVAGKGKAVVTLWRRLDFSNPFPLIPAFMIGYNRPDDTGPFYPQLTERMDINPPNLKSPYWGIRADRASVPAVFIFGDQGMYGMGVDPYIDNIDNSHTVNGLRVCLKRGIGVSIGHIVEPVQSVWNGVYAPGCRAYHEFDGTREFQFDLFSSDSPDRRGHAGVIRRLYKEKHESAPSGEGVHKTVCLLADAVVNDLLKPSRNELFDTMGGEIFNIKDRKPGFPATEIGWSGGAMAAYPFLQLQSRYKKPELEEYACNRLDVIADSINKDSGFFWDCQHIGNKHSGGWWTKGFSPVAHYSYTQGHACYYLLKSSQLINKIRLNGNSNKRVKKWIKAAKRVLERAMEFQMDNGRFPASFSVKTGQPENIIGFAGCWFAAALAHLYEIMPDKKYLDGAIRAIEGYHKDIITLTACGTPMDTHNAVDQEGNLALLHASAKLHQLTGKENILEILRDSADFEMMWRYYYNVRAPYSPLDSAEWGSSGGSVTSAHNPHIHPMQLNSLDQVLYLYDRTGEEYYLERTKDAVRYGCCCVCRESENFGWGKPGWLCERFCPSDGLIIQHNLKTGEPSSAGCDYHIWTVAVTLEGFTGQVWDRFPELA